MAIIKCNACKAVLSASPYDGSFVRYDGDSKYYCSECLTKKRLRARKNKWIESEVDRELAKLRRKTREHLDYEGSKDAFYTYIDKRYAPSFVPKHFYIKMASIFDGTYQGLKRPIPPAHLLDMLKSKEAFLDRQAIKKWGDHPPEPMSRVNYDIAIVMNRYDRYLAYQEEKRIENTQTIEQKTEPMVHVPYAQRPQAVKNELDIASIIDDLF